MPTSTTPTSYQPPAYPRGHLLAGVGVLLAQLGTGIAVYPHLPEEIPRHFSASGAVTLTATTPLSAFGPVLIYAALLALFAAATRLVLHTLPRDHPDAPPPLRDGKLNRPATRADAARGAIALMATAWIVGLVFALASAGVWFPGAVGYAPWFLPVLLVLLAATLIPSGVALYARWRERRDGSSGVDSGTSDGGERL
ncbi:DUF1648 domain-containing protein [Lipingzhangella sp. LS1_29]|uniref:DUF1648 domain-containing protein n=1 Tax=Lipingzhangella rawalii TaxID=2055835 RepID=A0ABU2H1K7_9ACTN|nr:DUF1648 domain-containing protein [Lipingzhangella rawalii]MDS1269183.1 DUF1648 domain-containing protein [Lipingzhangella rawalii]